MRTQTVRCATTLSLLTVPIVASAQQASTDSVAQAPSELDRRLELARRYANRENFEGALAEYTAVYRLFASTNDARRFEVLYTIGRTLQRMNRFDEAAEQYQRYLDEAPSDAPQRETCAQLVAYLRAQLGVIEVRSRVPRATLWIQGRLVGALPQLVRRPSGEVELEVRAPDHGSVRQRVAVLSQRTTAVTLDPVAIRARHGLPVAPFATVAAGSGATLVSWGATALVYTIERNRLGALDLAASQNQAVLPPIDQRCPPGETTRQDCYVVRPAMGVWSEEQSAAQRVATAANALLIASSVLAVGTVVLGFVTDFRSGGRLRSVVAVAPSATGAALTVGGAL